MRWGFALVLFMLSGSFAAAGKPSFDCETAKLAAELTICRVINLADSDARMAENYGRLMELAPASQKQRLRSEQRAWLKERNACGSDIACLLTVFSDGHLRLTRELNRFRDRAEPWMRHKPSFTCTAESSDAEKAICSDAGLSEQDRRLSEVYKTARGRAEGKVSARRLLDDQRTWLDQRNACGSDGSCLSRRMAERIAVLEEVGEPVVETKRVAKSAAQCARDRNELRREASVVDVSLHAVENVRVGDRIEVRWRRSNWATPEDTSAYLVLAFPEWVRFAGDYLIPLTPGAPAPGGLQHQRDKLRVIVPLTSNGAPRQGILSVRAYRAEALEIDAAMVATSSCGEIVLSWEKLPTVSLAPGAANIVIQDIYSPEAPERSIQSRDGRFRLDVFKASYRVYDVASGAKITERPGFEPNFSAEGRFVGAHVALSEGLGHQMEIFDLVARVPVTNLPVVGPTVGWGLSDSLLFDGTGYSPTLSVHRTLVDPPASPKAGLEGRDSDYIQIESGKGYAWAHMQASVFIDNGVVALNGGSTGTSVFDLASSQLLENAPRVESAGWEPRIRDVRRALAKQGVHGFDAFRGWQADGPVRLSHIDEEVDFGISGKESRFEGAELQREYLVQHLAITASKELPNPTVRLASARDWRVRATVSSAPASIEGQALRFASRLAEFGICLGTNCSDAGGLSAPEALVRASEFKQVENFVNWEQVSQFTRSTTGLVSEIIRDVPIARQHVATPDEDLRQRGEKFRFRLTTTPEFQSGTHGLWRGSAAGQPFWLVQTLHGWKGSLDRSSVTLFRGQAGGPGYAIDLAADALDSNEAVGLHRSFLGTKDERVLRLRPFLQGGRWLIVASPAGASAAVVDLTETKDPAYLYGLSDMYDAQLVGLTADGRRLVQLNTDGLFHLYEVATGERILSGRYVDDEIVLFTKEGYFWSSYEGAHYVHIGFAGRNELLSLEQFKSVLSRPDLLRSIITGTNATVPVPSIPIPPRLEFSISDASADRLTVSIAASAVGSLREVVIYADGRKIKTLPLSGPESQANITLDRPPHARVITAVAVDDKALTSPPVAAKVERFAGGSNALHLLSIGINAYDHVNALQFAKLDAETIVTAAEGSRGQYYAAVDATLLSDHDASPDRILEEIAAKVAAARPSDTIMLFFAGHGTRQDGQFYLATSQTRVDELEGTSLPWSRVADALARSQARVIVIIDACHAGQSGAQIEATNDDAVKALASANQTQMLVLAASKGRQTSLEMADRGGGVFTQTLASIVSSERGQHDLDGNGVIEASELYRGLKTRVGEITAKEQTPWLVRLNMIGDFPVF